MDTATLKIRHSFWKLFMISFLILYAGILQAGVFFIDCIEADNIQSVKAQLQTFALVSDSQDIKETILRKLDREFLLPNQIGLNEREPVRIITAADTAQTLSPSNPATVAILPITASREMILKSFSKRYPQQQTLPDCHGVLFSGNTDTNYFATAAVAFMGEKLLASPSATVLQWTWDHRNQLVNAPLLPGKSTFRMLANAPRFSQLVPVLYPKLGKYTTIYKRLADFSSVLFSITLNGEYASVRLRGTPRQSTQMKDMMGQWSEPTRKQWDILSKNTFFGSVSNSKKPAYLPTFFSSTYASLCSPIPLPETAKNGEHVSLLLPTANKKGFILLFFDQLKNERRITELPAPQLPKDIFTVETLPHRTVGKHTVKRCKIRFTPEHKKQKKQQLTESIFSLFLEKSVCEYAVIDQTLITAYGPEEPLIEQAIHYLSPRKDSLPLDKRLRIALQEEMGNFQFLMASRLQLAKGIRHLASILPNVDVEKLQRLPRGGDGINLVIGKDPKTNELSVLLGIQINEITSLKTIDKEIRPIAQEFLLHLLTQKLQQDL